MISSTTLRRVYKLASGEEVLVGPPSVGTAVALLETLEAAKEDADEEVVFEVLLDWLDPAVVADLAGRSREGRLKRLTALIMQGYERGPTRKIRGDGEREAPASWRKLISSYGRMYGADPWAVWTTVPFPFFLAMSDEMAAERARAILDDALAAGIPHAGKEGSKVLSQLKSTAKGRSGSALKDLVSAPTAHDRDAEAALEAEISRLYGANKR